jgi:hypothetical protein
MNTKKLIFAIFILSNSIFFQCSEHAKKESEPTVRFDISFGNKFYSLFVDKSGSSHAIKGTTANTDRPLSIVSSDTSTLFSLDSAEVLFRNIELIKSRPMVIDIGSDAPRVEIYYRTEKIYDSHKWDSQFWDIIRPVMTQIPKEYNPFLVDNKPFG